MARKLFMIGLLVAMVLGAVVVAAEDETTDIPPAFTDGRVNAYDVAAPVAVFYTYETQRLLDENGQPAFNEDGSQAYADVATGLELFAIDEDGNGHSILQLSEAEIQAALDAGETTFTGNGFQLNIGADGWYWLTGPTDWEGKSYSFSWDDMKRTLPESYTLAE
jgi:hypothetical protein